MQHRLPCLAVHDGRAGNVRQAEALAHGFDLRARSQSVSTHLPWRWFAPRTLPFASSAYAGGLTRWADASGGLVIGCGRQAALATRLLRARGCYAVQILDPRIAARHWDVVVVPEHDRLRGENVCVVRGSLNDVNDAWLEEHRAVAPPLVRMHESWGPLLLGAPTDDAPYSLEDVLGAIKTVCASADDSVFVCASPRTPREWRPALRETATAAGAACWLDGDDGKNPYCALLAHASHIVCTPDSVNMLSESCATRVPVEVLFSNRVRGRVGQFVQGLMADSRVRPVGSNADVQCEPLRERDSLVTEIKRRMAASGLIPAGTRR